MGIGALRRHYKNPAVVEAAPKVVEKPKADAVVVDAVVEEKPKAAPKTAK